MANWKPSTRTIKVKIGGIDYTSRLLQSSSPPGSVAGHLTIDNVITRRIDQCRFGLYPADGLDIMLWDEIIVSTTDEVTRHFAGFVTLLKRVPFVDVDGNDCVALNVDAQDYTCLLNKSIINREWTDETDKVIVQEIISYADPDLSADVGTATYVTENATLGKFRASRLTAREAIDRLAEIIGADWFIDYDGELHWFITEEETSVIQLSDEPNYSTSFPYSDLSESEPGIDIINRVIVIGGHYRSDDTTYILQGTGQDTHISLPFKAHAPDGYNSIRVWRNDGTEGAPDWTALTVRVGYVDELEGADEVLHYYQEKALEQQANWPELPNACKVTAQYEIPLRVEIRDNASYNRYGRWLTTRINDTNITTKAEARLRGKALLAAYALANPAYRCKTFEPGIRAGEMVLLTDSALNLDDYLLVQRVVTRQLPNGLVATSINLGAYNPDLIDIIIALKRLTMSDVEWREDEILDILFTQYEILELSESVSLSTSEPPYTWGDGGSNDTEWGFGSWA